MQRVHSIAQQNEDPLLAAFASLRDRELRGEVDGRFIAEGEVVLRVLLAQRRYPILAVLLADAQWERLQEALFHLPPEIPVYVAPLAVMREIVGFPIHRGILALGSRGADAALSDVVPAIGKSIVVGLCGITNHDNVGGIFRNAAAFAVNGAMLDRATCDPLYRKAVRVSVGGSLVVPHAFVADEGAMIDALVERGYTVLALSPRGALRVGVDPPPVIDKLALLVGSEGPGLSSRTIARCQSARIEMVSGWDSLNVAVTSGIALHWLHRVMRPSCA